MFALAQQCDYEYIEHLILIILDEDGCDRFVKKPNIKCGAFI